MKRNILVSGVAVMAMCAFALFSCSKDGGGPKMTEDQAADMIGEFVALTFSKTMGDLASLSNEEVGELSANCGTEKDSTLIKNIYPGGILSYSDTLIYNYGLNCSALTPTSMEAEMTGKDERTGPKMISKGTSDGSWTVTGTDFALTEYTVNGTYFTSESINERNVETFFIVNNNFSPANVVITKTTKELKSGSMDFGIVGVNSESTSFSFSGAVTFKSDGTATISIGSSLYSVNLSTAVVTKG